MAALGSLGRFLGLVVGGGLLLAGGLGLASVHLPEQSLLDGVYAGIGRGLAALRDAGVDVPGDAFELRQRFSESLTGLVLTPLGAVVVGLSLFGGSLLPSGGGSSGGRSSNRDAEAESSGPHRPNKFEKKLLKKTQRSAATLAKKGRLADAAEMLFESGDLETAAGYFIDAKQFARAAEIRHDQNRFLESADLYLKAGKFDSAGTIFSQQEEWGRAAECYLKIDRKSVAAEMFEKAEKFREAAKCYKDAGFLRHAAQAFVNSKDWVHAANCLSQVLIDEGGRGQSDPKKAAEMSKLVRQAGKLYRRAGDLEKAQAILEKGGCVLDAAELALEQEQYAKAAELFLDAGEARRAAEALRALGENEEAARILGQYHRDQGEVKDAAAAFEEAGDFLSAGDLYRQLEDYLKAGQCYQKQNEFNQAAEMFKAGDDVRAAGECFERGGCFAEAAECFASVGMPEKQAKLLDQAGEHLRAGQCYHREGLDDQAITVLQQVEPESPDFSTASALLGDIFQAHGQLPLAVKKLEQAIGEAELARENLDVYYTLARVHDANTEPREAVEIYEKILTFDYHYKDTEKRLLAAREVVKSLPPPPSETQAAAGTGSTDGARPGPVGGQPGRYQIVGELGRGGMGIVYKAKDTVLDRIVAYKVLPDSLNENPEALEGFLREAKSAAKLNHPNIVTVYDCGEQEGRYYIAMEYVDGTTLKEIVRRRGGISPAGIFHVAVQVCEALAYAHEKKVVHRDIKTANAMWTRDKKAKIMDFGLAKVMEEVRNHTTVVAGTPYYMSPEQTLGRNVDHRTDIYSLGATIFEMATGTVPFKEGNIPYHHVHTPPPDIRDLKPELPESLAKIVSRCLMKDPSKRYQSAGDLNIEVRALLASSAES